jgi:hypothetical protein
MHTRRSFVLLFALAVSLTPALAPSPAVAQAAAASFPCTGNVNVVRISDIKPGMMDKFLQAVAAQKAWYKNAGAPDRIGVMRIMDRDPSTKAYTLSETQAITTHIEPANSKAPAHDAGFDAFVALFSASSTIKTQYLTCVVGM